MFYINSNQNAGLLGAELRLSGLPSDSFSAIRVVNLTAANVPVMAFL